MMSPLTRLAVAFLLFSGAVQAGTPFGFVKENQECGVTLLFVYRKYAWPGVGYGSSYGAACQNPNAVVSMYASLYTYCPPEEWQPGVAGLNAQCLRRANVPFAAASDYAANLTTEAIAALPVYEAKTLRKSANVTAPFLMSQAWFDISRRSEHWRDYEQRLRAYYTFAGYGFWAIVLVFGIVQNAVYKAMESRQGYVYADAERHDQPTGNAKPSTPFGRVAAVLRKYVVTPSALPPYHQRRFLGCTIPTRAETFVVAAYWTISIVLGAVNIHSFRGNTFWPVPAAQIWRYVAERAGVMSYGNLPLMWLFAGRNNVFLWLTGWSFGTFSIFHRHIARLATLQGIVHGIAFTCFYFASGSGDKYRSSYAKAWWCFGVAAVAVMSFIVLFSFSVLRNKLYEHFLLVHIVLSVLLLVFLYHHTAIFALGDYNNPFILTACILWGFDRFLRLVRQAYVNLHVRSRSRNRVGSRLQTTKATVTYNEAANLLVVDVVPGNARLFPGPGQHYFLYQPLRLFGWENHPFTLGHWHRDTPTDGGDLHLQFWIRPYDGWTKKLRTACTAQAGAGSTLAHMAMAPAMLLEGPYGNAEPLHTFDQVLLVAGGSGIAGVLPYLQDHVRRVEQGADAVGAHGRIPTRTRHMTLIWADRSEACLRFLADGPLAGLRNRPDVTVSLHLTGTKQQPSSVSDSSTASSCADVDDAHVASVKETSADTGADKEVALSGFATEKGVVLQGESPAAAAVTSGFRIQSGRPDVLSVVRKMAQSVQDTDARLGIMVCGPSDLADNVRHAVAQNMESTRESIEYFEERFGW
ncbi:FRE family ferric-chelate reductase [Sporothrix schenckii 1099-18]|uniref:FRE family ferric-chelate reductase n=1 Tax=Sporothrix schenckii 1099-18 TaxID=1397361 RepID=A0A0F2M8P5_SPOSC|nr:FRE family ferric-chelate reductase [Sporothrix schenckii 1099-18]KJR86002.1 FRE family ferric-chelate reductase [Sporothrix schenckii 1099-18]